jgi:hypothetical protein
MGSTRDQRHLVAVAREQRAVVRAHRPRAHHDH